MNTCEDCNKITSGLCDKHINEMKDEIKKIDVNLFPESNKDEYDRYVKDWNERFSGEIESSEQYVPGGFFSIGHYVKTPEVGRAKAERLYGKEPEPFNAWQNHRRYLNTKGQQELIDTVNKIIDKINDL